MNILEKIVTYKRVEVGRLKIENPPVLLEKSKFFRRIPLSLERAVLDSKRNGIIAEFKRQSPSRGVINKYADPAIVCPRYLEAGASALSVLTDGEYFGGSNNDLLAVRDLCDAPILRKEFIIDEYQVVEAKSIGADAILLIADILTAREMKILAGVAESLDLEVLFEIHNESGIAKLPADARLIGINSRNLGNFSVDMDILKKTFGRLPETSIKIAESGIHSAGTLAELRNVGFDGFLIGEMFMKENNPGERCTEFINDVNAFKNITNKK